MAGVRSTGDSFKSQFAWHYKEAADKIGQFNLAIFGKTGAGKSTLINAIFGEAVAKTGIGEPVTQDEHLYIHKSGTFGLLDTRGLEVGADTDTIIEDLRRVISERRTKPLKEQMTWPGTACVRLTAGSRTQRLRSSRSWTSSASPSSVS